MRRSVYCTASFSICSLRRAKFPIIYPVLWLDYKVATHPQGHYAYYVIIGNSRSIASVRHPDDVGAVHIHAQCELVSSTSRIVHSDRVAKPQILGTGCPKGARPDLGRP